MPRVSQAKAKAKAKSKKKTKSAKYAWGRKLLQESQLCFLLPKDMNLGIESDEVDNDIYRAQNGFWHKDIKVSTSFVGDAVDWSFINMDNEGGDDLIAYSLKELHRTGINDKLDNVFFELDIDGVSTGNAIKADGSIIRSLKGNEPIDMYVRLRTTKPAERVCLP